MDFLFECAWIYFFGASGASIYIILSHISRGRARLISGFFLRDGITFPIAIFYIFVGGLITMSFALIHKANPIHLPYLYIVEGTVWPKALHVISRGAETDEALRSLGREER